MSNLTTRSTTVRSFQKNARVCLWIKRSLESFTVWVLRRTASLFWNRGWWNINYNVFSLRGTARHLQKNRHIAENQVQNPQDTNINLTRFKLVNEISAHWNIERDSTQMWEMDQESNIKHKKHRCVWCVGITRHNVYYENPRNTSNFLWNTLP